MNHGTKTIALPELTANLLRDGGCLIDNLFADLWKQTGMKARLDRIGFHKGCIRKWWTPLACACLVKLLQNEPNLPIT